MKWKIKLNMKIHNGFENSDKPKIIMNKAELIKKGTSYYGMGIYSEALKCFEKLLHIYENNGDQRISSLNETNPLYLYAL